MVMYVDAFVYHKFDTILDFVLFSITKDGKELRMCQYQKKDRVVYPTCSRLDINQSHTSSLNVKRRFVQD